MISVSEAEKIIRQHPFKPKTEKVKLVDSVGSVLAESVHSDRDFPPFHRVAMDGIAIQFSSFENGSREFKIEDTQPAGVSPLKLKNKENCIEVMTGASLPNDTDTVIRYEDLEIKNSIAKITIEEVAQAQNVHAQGSDIRSGKILLLAGDQISPAEVALLASIGKAEVQIYQKPTIVIAATGDELVDIHETPLPHQIRSSNVYALQSALRTDGLYAITTRIPDDKKILEKEIVMLLDKHDVLILTGGVSKGKYDYIPEVLVKSGVKNLFHVVAQRPGKPLWFGRSEKNTVFALPGNPVSSFMCYYRYIRPWLLESLGNKIHNKYAILKSDFQFPPPLTYFLQVIVSNEKGNLIASPIQGGGSGDFVNLKGVTGFLELPSDKKEFKAGEVFPYFPFRD
ncbi:MAG: molybdopterin molybdotransferase MoeA [Flammeovirgaceae bacterium]|nr:molybdopterin molybdotransferase MoeA [Flammeovirgaceae bacterium]